MPRRYVIALSAIVLIIWISFDITEKCPIIVTQYHLPPHHHHHRQAAAVRRRLLRVQLHLVLILRQQHQALLPIALQLLQVRAPLVQQRLHHQPLRHHQQQRKALLLLHRDFQLLSLVEEIALHRDRILFHVLQLLGTFLYLAQPAVINSLNAQTERRTFL